MKEKDRKMQKKNNDAPDSDIHPGAYITDYDINNELLDTVDSADDVFTPNGNKKGKWANPASPPAADPPVPNRAHTEM
jgi:hypothetical protein